MDDQSLELFNLISILKKVSKKQEILEDIKNLETEIIDLNYSGNNSYKISLRICKILKYAVHLFGNIDETFAFIFGNEQSGLTNDQQDLCQIQLTIDANPVHPSLNVASTVQIIAYEIRMALLEDENRADDWDVERATNHQTELLIEHMDELMKEVDFYDVNNPRKLLVRVRRFFKRSRIDVMETNIFRGLFSTIQKKLK